MKLPIVFFIIAFLFSLLAGGIFIFDKKREINIRQPVVSSTTTIIVVEKETEQKFQNLDREAQALIAKTQEFIEREKEKKNEIDLALRKSSQVKGIYVSSAYNQAYFKSLLAETELNSIVIDTKEAYGINLPNSLKTLINDLHQKDVWLIARIVVFRDSSLTEKKPEWYLKTATSTLWQDGARHYWLDPQNPQVQDYLIEFSKKVIDFGFDELQFDYIRYSDDYKIENLQKTQIIGDFFSKLSLSLKEYKPSIILSVDLFGYLATQFQSFDTGQRLIDAAKVFDYLSFMLYPSHFYGGIKTDEIYFPYPEVVEHPYEVIYYSVKTAFDYLSLFGWQSKIRPWLQDFDLVVDTSRGVFYNATSVQAEIEAAQNATSSGWLLWNPSNIYTKEALNQ